MISPKLKYKNDSEYNQLLEYLEDLLSQGKFTLSELREACVIACHNYERKKNDNNT